jgi:hypothetical protein
MPMVHCTRCRRHVGHTGCFKENCPVALEFKLKQTVIPVENDDEEQPTMLKALSYAFAANYSVTIEKDLNQARVRVKAQTRVLSQILPIDHHLNDKLAACIIYICKQLRDKTKSKL